MKKDKFKTEVMFRKTKQDKSIEAFFPYDIQDMKGNILSYAHLGQHSTACYDYLLFNTIPAKEDESVDLKKELESIGYNLKIIKRRNYTRFLKTLNKLRNEN